MECIEQYLKQFSDNTSMKEVIYTTLKSKVKTKNLRDKMIVETFDNYYSIHSAEYAYNATATKFDMSVENIKYIVRNRCLL